MLIIVTLESSVRGLLEKFIKKTKVLTLLTIITFHKRHNIGARENQNYDLGKNPKLYPLIWGEKVKSVLEQKRFRFIHH